MGYITFADDHQSYSLNPQVVNSKEKWLALAKLASIVGFALFLIVGLFFYSQNRPIVAEAQVRNSLGKVEYTAPYKNILYENFGFVNEPKLTLPLKTQTGYKKITFLLDSGAVVSALPLQAAKDVGVNFSTAKRIALQGFSGIPTFAYYGDITIKLGKRDFTFPAVFTESNGTSYILGRKGFFDQFSIYFDNRRKTVTITSRSK